MLIKPLWCAEQDVLLESSVEKWIKQRTVTVVSFCILSGFGVEPIASCYILPHSGPHAHFCLDSQNFVVLYVYIGLTPFHVE